MQKAYNFNPVLDKYFWDHTRNASDVFKLKRLLEYASFPDLLKIPFEFVKANINRLDPETLRTSQMRRRFIKEIQANIQTSNTWDEVIFHIAGIE
ncbi:MAG TPA: hypothetical protein VK469_12265 [Candidatus Kapabacteria bacterium]|nr:hypothetical protein [Candidatus Kapabacteria bacterium]